MATAKKRKYAGGGVRKAGIVICKSARHWRTGKPILPVNAKALAFYPRKKQAS